MPCENIQRVTNLSPRNAGANLLKNMTGSTYKGRRKIFNAKEYEARRKQCIAYKPDATVTAFSELEGLINKSALARQYFGRSQSWLSQRLNGCTVLDKTMSFKKEEFDKLADAFRDIAGRLLAHAEEIDAAAFD